MAEVLIRLERPASLSPQLRAWLRNGLGAGRAVLVRSRLNGSASGALLLRIEVHPDSSDAVQEAVADLMTDLRLLGLHPMLVSEQVV